MKVLFIEAHYVGDITLTDSLIKELPNKVGLVSSIQFIKHLPKIKKQLERWNKEGFIAKGSQPYPGQVLGCDVSSATRLSTQVNAYLCVGSGEFHPLGIAMNTNKPVFVFNPMAKKHYRINAQDIEKYKKRKKGAYIKFLHSKNIGLLISKKPGQCSLEFAFRLKEKLKDKNCYIFVSDGIETNKLEDFNFIECWINLACPRLDDPKLLNISDIKTYIDFQ